MGVKYNKYKYKVGDCITWTSQAQGHEKTKQGKIMAICPKGYSFIDIDPNLTGYAYAYRGERTSWSEDRYIVAVPKLGKRGWLKPRLYTPTVSYINKNGRKLTGVSAKPVEVGLT
jgi:hypothetical protein